MTIIPPDITVALILEKWPEVTPVFIRYRMACVGCSLSRFESVSDAAVIYNIPYELFHQELLAAISDETGRGSPNSSEERI